MKHIALLFFFILSYTLAFTQNGYIVKFSDKHGYYDIKNKFNDINLIELSTYFNIYLLNNVEYAKETKLLSYLNTSPRVISYNNNHCISEETRCLFYPNDSLLGQQWGHFKTNIDKAWCKTKGGLTSFGDTIVIGVLEVSGIDYQHRDLVKNVWKNKLEIPNNKIDDDNNGITDDYYGINCKTKDDKHIPYRHGTEVLGILGAIGDNNVGIVGVTPFIKMALASSAQFESDWIVALNYFFELRKLYNNSNGEKGAFIPVINISGGFDRLRSNDMPILCNLFDELGKVGILTVNAVTNDEINIDNQGDMPADCPSDFLITVTNSEQNDKKYQNCGFGIKNVDLAAPGTDIVTTTLNNQYTEILGTSAACPYVSGAIALLYSLPVKEFSEDKKINPANTAMKVKKYLLDGVQTLSSLNKYVKTSGRLDILGSIKLFEEDYSAISNLIFEKIYPNPVNTYLNFVFSTNTYSQHIAQLFDIQGRIIEFQNIQPNTMVEMKSQINISNLPNGIYFLKLSNNTDSSVEKIIVLH